MRYTIREWIYSESIILDSNYSALKVPSVLQRDGWVRNLWCFEGFRFLVSGKEDRRQADKHRALLVHSVQRGSWLLRILFNQIWHGGFNLGEGERGCWGMLDLCHVKSVHGAGGCGWARETEGCDCKTLTVTSSTKLGHGPLSSLFFSHVFSALGNLKHHTTS